MGTSQFIGLEEPRIGGGNKDFFPKDDAGFARQKARIQGRVQAIASTLLESKLPAGFVKVVQREEALAKSHRPLHALFSRRNNFGLVGSGAVGEMIFQVTPSALQRLCQIIEQRAELEPRIVLNRQTGKEEPRVSAYRSEIGSIKDIVLHEPSDRVAFSAEEAIAWMRQPNVVGGYIVELFRPHPELAPEAVSYLIKSFQEGLDRIGGSMLVRSLLSNKEMAESIESPMVLSVKLLDRSDQRLVELPFLSNGRMLKSGTARLSRLRGQLVPRDLNPARHSELLAFLAEQSIVRTVELPPIIETAPSAVPSHAVETGVLPLPPDGDHPVVGIIDGGVADLNELNAWKVGDAGLVPTSLRSEGHGTFIAGLVVAGAALNPNLPGVEPSGCKFFDLDFFPRSDLRSGYYHDLEDFFDQLEEKVRVARQEHGVRVFNLSFAFGSQRSDLGYSVVADRLDRLAQALDVVFVVSAGNLLSNATRPPWPEKPGDAVTMLAGFSRGNNGIRSPSEHMLGITVGAVNPPGVTGHVAHMPTTYTCRGPGVGGGRKPDLAHYGGASGNSTGLFSISPEGEGVQGCGTSYAAPLTAANIATLDHRLARQAPRETLLALPIHRADRPIALCSPKLRHVARDFIGFGLAPTADAMLNDDLHSVTLVFNDRLRARQRLDFSFAWPRSLVLANSACQGRAEITLAYTPPIALNHREEAMRVQLEAHLHQENVVDDITGETEWVSQLTHDGAGMPQGMHKTEKSLISTGLKWSPIKRYHAHMPKGRGTTSNWRLSLDSLVRAGSTFPLDGVPFTLLLTISDPKGAAPVREEVRVDLQNRGLVLADITIAHRVRPRA